MLETVRIGDNELAKSPVSARSLRRGFKGLRVNGQTVSVELPLLERVYDLNAEIALKFPASFDPGLGQMGLLLGRQLVTEGYWCTPINSLCFGCTGGDGAHFSFLVTEDAITDHTPIIVTVPDGPGDAPEINIVLACGFEDFVRLGLHCGYFAMSQFAFNTQENLEHYARTDWDNEWFPSRNHRGVAEYASQALNLERLIYTPDEFASLQSKFRPLMQFREPEW